MYARKTLGIALGLALIGIAGLALFKNGPAGATSGSFVRGDADASGTYSYTADFNYIMAYLFASGPAPDPMDGADANDDGAVTVADASYLANYNAGGSAPPAPFSAAGFDPTPDPNEPDCDSILTQYDAPLTSYLPSSASSVQDVRPLATQRGVGLDGVRRAASTHAFQFAANPFERPLLGGEVIQESTGTYALLEADIALPATGFSWVIGRTYNARQETSGSSHRNSDGYQGKNWFQTSQPEIVHYDGASDSEDIVYLIYGADRFLEFKRLDQPGTASNTFRGINGAAGSIVFTSGGASVPDTYVYTDQAGNEHSFFGFDTDVGSAAGQYWKTEDAAGNVAFVGDETTAATAITNGYTSGKIQYAYDTSDRRYTYTYTTLDSVSRLTRVVAETKAGGTWGGTPTGVAEVARVDYDYYSNETHGDVGDLKTVTLTTPLTDSGQSLTQTKYYRYYEGTYHATTNPGYPHGLKLIVGFEGCRNYDYNGAGDSSFDDDFLTETTANLEPYAEAYFEYDTSHRIKSCWMSGACGCSGGLNGTYNFAYATNGTDDAGYDEDEWRYRTVIDRPDSGYTTLYFDEVAQPTARVVTDADPSASPTKTWSTVLDRDDSGRVDSLHTPANVTAYTHSTGAFTKSTSAGLVRHFVRETDPPLAGYATQRKWSDGTSGSAYLDGDTNFTSNALTVGDSEVARAFVSSVREYTQEVTSGTTGSNLTSITTSLHSGTLVPSTVTVTLPDVSTANNGEGTTSTTQKKYYNASGENTFDKSTDGIITYREYTNGQVTKLIQDADTASLSPPAGFASSGTELDWTTTHEFDAQGRRTVTKLPSGLDKEVYYSQLKDRRLVTLAYNDVVSSTFYGPVQLSVLNHGRKPEVTATLGLPSNSSTLTQTSHIDETVDDPITAVAGAWDVSRMRVSVYDSAGARVEQQRVYFDMPTSGAGTDGTHYDPTLYGYDDSGRRWRVKQAHGTVQRSVYDLHGNVTEQWMGTNDSSFSGGEPSGTDNMVKTHSFEFDSGSGGGNQYLTKHTAFVEDSAANQRVTTFTNDPRGRRLLEARPAAPHAFHKYDNLGRSIATGLFSSTANIVAASDDPTTETSNRVQLTQSFYDERGRMWKSQRHKIDSSDGSDDDNLTNESWFDREGRLCKRDGTQLEKLAYDRLGRNTHRFLLASDNDTTYADALNVTGDVVLEEGQQVYDGTGNLVLQARIDREHDGTGAGALDSNADNDDLAYTAANISGRIQITSYWYDGLNRQQDTVRYGTYGGATFDREGLAVPARSDTALRVTYAYNNLGSTEVVTDPRAIDYYTGYDDQGRVTSSVSNASANPPGTPSGTDTNRTISYAYTDGLQTTMTVDMPSGTDDQVTTYTYGTTKGATAGDSEVATGHLLQRTQYPEGATDEVEFAYNAQGERIWKEDQAGNVVETDYSNLGQVTAQRVTGTIATGFDDAVQRVVYSYDSSGRLEVVTQYDNDSGGSIVDEAKFTYGGWGRVTKFEQDHNSAVGASGSVDDYEISHAYAKATSGRNTIRRSSTTLPDSTVVDFNYRSTGGLHDADASRVSDLCIGSQVLAEYDYLGGNTTVGVEYDQPVVFSRLYNGSGAYTDHLDRFSRVVSWQWTKDLTTDLDFVDMDYGWDRNSNVTHAQDHIHVDSNSKGLFDVEYSYDSVNRLTQAQEGNWTGSAISDEARDQEWVLDHVGGWDRTKLDLNGDGDFVDTGEHDDDRVYNKSNEATTYKGQTPAYDANGNLCDDKDVRKFEYDVWNRLRFVRDQSDKLIAEYRYNGLGHQIAVHKDWDGDGTVESTSDDPWHRQVFDERWRLFAVFAGSDADPTEQFVFHESGGGEASQRNDNLVFRDRDTDGNGTLDERLYYCHNWRGDVVSVIDSSGKIREWVKYSAYGVPFGIPGGDVDQDWDCDGDDATEIQHVIDTRGYEILADLDLDSDVDAGDKTLAEGAPYLGQALGRGELSGHGSARGLAGDLWDAHVGSVYHIRSRVLGVEPGHWLQRDPLGYVDGPGLYSYVRSNPLRFSDPGGKQAQDECQLGQVEIEDHWIEAAKIKNCSLTSLTGSMNFTVNISANASGGVSVSVGGDLAPAGMTVSGAMAVGGQMQVALNMDYDVPPCSVFVPGVSMKRTCMYRTRLRFSDNIGVWLGSTNGLELVTEIAWSPWLPDGFTRDIRRATPAECPNCYPAVGTPGTGTPTGPLLPPTGPLLPPTGPPLPPTGPTGGGDIPTPGPTVGPLFVLRGE